MIEIPQKRTANSKHFQKEEGLFEAHISASDIHYIDENLTYQDIECKLFDEFDFVDVNTPPSLEGRERFYIKKGELFFDKKTRDDHDFQALKVPFECVLPRKFKRGYSIGKRDDKLKFIPVGANNVIGEIQGDTIHFIDGWTDTDITLQVTNNGIKETIILKSASSPKLFSFEVSGNLADDLTAGELHLEYAWLKDANGIRRDVLQTIRREDSKTFIDLTVDISDLTYPVIVDPTVTFMQGGVPDNGSTYSRNSTVYPPNTTVEYAPNGNQAVREYNIATGFYWVGVALKRYNTASIPDIAVINKAILTYSNGGANEGGRQVNAEWYTGPLDTTAYTINSPSTAASGITMGNVTNASITLSNPSANINKTGYTTLRFTVSGGTPTNSSYAELYETSLQITYSMPPTAPSVIAPNGGETWNAQHTISWTAAIDLTDKLYDFKLAGRDTTDFISDTYDQGQTFLTGDKPETLTNIRVAINSQASVSTPLYVSLFNTDGTLPTTEIVKMTVTSGGGGSYPIVEVAFPDNALTPNTRYAIVLNNPPQASFQVFRNNANVNGIGYRVEKNGATWTTQTSDLAMEIQTRAETDIFTSTIVNSAYDTDNNIGRKIVKLSNGWLVSVIRAGSAANLYKSTDGGLIWQPLCSFIFASGLHSIVSRGTTVWMFCGNGSSQMKVAIIDVLTQTNVSINMGTPSSTVITVDTGQNVLGDSSIAIHTDGTLHAAWASTNPTYNNCYNIRYSKSIDGGSTWATPTQLTTANIVDMGDQQPCIIVKDDGNPIIFTKQFRTANNPDNITSYRWTGSSWSPPTSVGLISGQVQSNPCAAIAPNGRIWCAWHGFDSIDSAVSNIRIKYSDNGGTTWINGGITAEKLTSGNTRSQQAPSISINSSGKVFVIWNGQKTGVNQTFDRVMWASYSGSAWSSTTLVENNDTVSSTSVGSLMNNTLNFDVPIAIYKYNGTSVKFVGPVTLQYHIQLSTDNGGSWSDIVSLSPANVTSYSYDFTPVVASTQAKIRIRAFNGISYSSYDESNAVFTIQHNQLSDSTITSPVHNVGYLVGLRPRISITSTDPDANTLTDIHIQIGSNVAFSSGIIIDTTSGASATGWTFTTIPSGGSTFYTPQIDLGYGVRYIRVRTYDGTAWGNWSPTVQVNFVNPNWSNPNIGDEDSGIRKVWIDELRTHINNVRLARGLVAFNFTDPTLTADVTNVRVQHIIDLRNSISAVHTTIGLTAPVWTDPTITANVTNRRGIHIKQLRTAAQSG